MRYPIGVQDFGKIIERNLVYIDKTDLVYELAGQNVCFLSRPRRFGKSLLVSTLDAYFSGRKELFKGLKIDALETEWAEYPIFRIDFASGDYSDPSYLSNRLEEYIANCEAQYGKNDTCTTLTGRFEYVLKQAAAKTGHKSVVLIDEYDKPILDVLGTEMEEKNRNTLKGFYGTFKAADADLRFVLLTGVTKFSQISVFSGFNQPDDISMDSKYDALCGITEDELYYYFAEPIAAMAQKMNLSVDETKYAVRVG